MSFRFAPWSGARVCPKLLPFLVWCVECISNSFASLFSLDSPSPVLFSFLAHPSKSSSPITPRVVVFCRSPFYALDFSTISASLLPFCLFFQIPFVVLLHTRRARHSAAVDLTRQEFINPFYTHALFYFPRRICILTCMVFPPIETGVPPLQFFSFHYFCLPAPPPTYPLPPSRAIEEDFFTVAFIHEQPSFYFSIPCFTPTSP